MERPDENQGPNQEAPVEHDANADAENLQVQDDDDDEEVEEDDDELDGVEHDQVPLFSWAQDKDGVDSVKKFGDALARNKKFTALILLLECSDSGTIDLALDSAHEGIYQAVETSKTMDRLHMSGYDGFDRVTTNLFHRIASRKHKNQSLSVTLHECAVRPDQLTILLRCPHLKELELSSSIPLPSDEGWKEARQALAENTSLKSLSLGGHYAALFGSPVEETQSNLRCLGFSGSHLNYQILKGVIRKDWKQNITQFLHQNPHVREVRVKQELYGVDLEPFATGLSQRGCKVSLLWLECHLDRIGYGMLVDMLRTTSSVRNLIVIPNYLLLDTALQGLLGNRSVESATFLGRSMDRIDPFRISIASHISQLLRVQHFTLRKLTFRDCLDASCVSELLRGLAVNTTLTSLSVQLQLSSLAILTENLATEMAHCLHCNTTLTEFRWESTIQTRSAARIMFDALKTTKAKIYLKLHYPDKDKPVDGRTLDMLAAGLLESCQSVMELSINDDAATAISAGDPNVLLKALERNRTIESLKFRCHEYSFAPMDNVLVDQWIQTLPRLGSHLKELTFTFGGSIRDHDRYVEVAQALSCNLSLESIRLDRKFNPPPYELQCCLEKNKKRREFLVSTATGGTCDSPPSTSTPPLVLAWVLATVAQQPCSASVRYEILRRNVHALVGKTIE